jgi:hypothetical protein
VWADFDEASEAAAIVKNVLCPLAGSRQEIYFNSRHFARS